ELLVALAGRDELVLPVRERVRACGGKLDARAVRDFQHRAAHPADLYARLLDGIAHPRASLDLRLHELLLYLGSAHAPLMQKLLDIRGQLARVGVDDLVLFLDAEVERGS